MVHSAWTSPRQNCTTSLPSQSKGSGTSRTNTERRKFEGHAAVLGTCTKYRLDVATRTTDHLDSRLTAVARQVRLPSTNDAQVASMDCASPSDGSEHFKFRAISAITPFENSSISQRFLMLPLLPDLSISKGAKMLWLFQVR